MKRRPSARKALDPIHVAAITVGERPTVLATAGTLRNASATGLLIRVHWRALNPPLVQANGALAVPHGTLLRIHIVEMVLDLEGGLGRMAQTGPEWGGIAMGFSARGPTDLGGGPGRVLPPRGGSVP